MDIRSLTFGDLICHAIFNITPDPGHWWLTWKLEFSLKWMLELGRSTNSLSSVAFPFRLLICSAISVHIVFFVAVHRPVRAGSG